MLNQKLLNEATELDSSIIALVSLASGIAAKHPAMGLCQLEKLRQMGVAESQIETVIEVARHIRDEAGEKIDAAFDQSSKMGEVNMANKENIVEEENETCCSNTVSGQSCC